MLTEDEMILAVKAAASLGFRKLRITGGEPLIKENILSICSRAAAVEGINEVCLTTNGTLLPQLAKPLREAGVQRVNISLDTLSREKYTYITRRDALSSVRSGIESAMEADFSRIKINAVLIGGFNDEEISDLARLTVQYPVDVRFIELMPMDGSGEFDQTVMISSDAVLARLPELVPVKSDGGVARLYRLPNSQGNIGLISSVSRHFCAECNRLRLTADGKLKPCLHSAEEYDLKGLSFDGMTAQFRRAILHKPLQHAELSARQRSGAERTMNCIGG